MVRELLAIGVETYRDGRFVNLDHTHEDARNVCRFFRKELPKGYRFDRATLMKDPTATEVTRYLEDVLKRLDDDSVFVFYFSGHGLYNRDIERQLLLCADAAGVLADGRDGAGALTLDYMTTFSQRARGKIIFIYDVCREVVERGHKGVVSDYGGATKFMTATSEKPDAQRYGGTGPRWSFMSCGEGQRAKDDGSFVKAFLGVMRDTVKTGRDLLLENESFVQRVYYRLEMGNQRPEASGDAIILAPAVLATERRGVGFAVGCVVALFAILFGLSQRSTDSVVKELKELITDQSFEITWKTTQISELERENRELSKLLDEIKESGGAAPDLAEFLKLKDENASLSKELADLKRQSSSTTQGSSSKDAELAVISKRYEALQKKAESLNSELSSKDARIKELESKNATYEKYRSESAAKLTAAYNNFASLWHKNYTLNETIKSLRARLSEQSKDGQTEEPIFTQPTVTSEPVAGSPLELTINDEKVVFRYCPAGSFMMGSPDSEEDRYADEVQHEVILTKGFWLLETEVTQALWYAVMYVNPSHYKGDEFPVESVSWDDCFEFVRRLNQIRCAPEGMVFDFPTEAEWEYACRAGSKTPFSFGNEISVWKVNYNVNIKRTTPVKKYLPNAWNLYDMHGNVWEWVYDWYGEYPTDSVTDPKGPVSGSHRVRRGGGWYSIGEHCRAAYRSNYVSSRKHDYYGFRLALRSIE